MKERFPSRGSPFFSPRASQPSKGKSWLATNGVPPNGRKPQTGGCHKPQPAGRQDLAAHPRIRGVCSAAERHLAYSGRHSPCVREVYRPLRPLPGERKQKTDSPRVEVLPSRPVPAGSPKENRGPLQAASHQTAENRRQKTGTNRASAGRQNLATQLPRTREVYGPLRPSRRNEMKSRFPSRGGPSFSPAPAGSPKENRGPPQTASSQTAENRRQEAARSPPGGSV